MSEKETKKYQNEPETDSTVNTAEEERSEPQIPETEEELEELVLKQQEKIAELESQLEETQDAKLRKTAELDNIKKRVQRDRSQIYEAAKIDAIEAFLPINDDLQRTVKALDESSDNEKDLTGVADGIRMIANKFEEVLKRYDVVRIDETGVPFDVDLHDAMLRQKPQDDSIESGTVLQVLENGYRIGDKTLRHAKVIVSE